MIGMTLQDVLATGAEMPRAAGGWAYYTILPSGWSAGFNDNGTSEVEALKQDSKIAWFFKRR
jgi:N-methylhydantoinase B/oxoprolinase/acetone carboxylase alpha subunit